MIYRGSTPVLPIEIDGVDLSNARLYLTIANRQRGGCFTVRAPEDFTVTYDSENEVSEADVPLTQEQTLAIAAGNCVGQIRYIFADGVADVTDPTEIQIGDILMGGVISYE